MGNDIELIAGDGHRLSAYQSLPNGTPKGGVIVVQEVFGVNSYIRSRCEMFSAEGYAVISPSLYDRQQPGVAFDEINEDSLAVARKLRVGLNWDHVMLDVSACIQNLSEHGDVGIVGYCVGGSVAWLAATKLKIAAASCYYGKDIAHWENLAPSCPTILHYGIRDPLIPESEIEVVKKRYPGLSVYVYEAGHGFDREQGDTAAVVARHRTSDLFSRQIVKAWRPDGI